MSLIEVITWQQKNHQEVLTLFYIVFFFLLYIAMEDYDSKSIRVAVTINNMANDTFDDEEHNIL